MKSLQLLWKSSTIGLVALFVVSATAASLFADGGYAPVTAGGSNTFGAVGGSYNGGMPTGDTPSGGYVNGSGGQSVPPSGGTTRIGPDGTRTQIMSGRNGRPGPLVVTRPSNNSFGSSDSDKPVQPQSRAMSSEDRLMIAAIQARLEELHSARFRFERLLSEEDAPSNRFFQKATLTKIRKDIWKYQQVVNSIRNKYIDDPNQRYPVETEYYEPMNSFPPGPPGTHNRF